MVGWIAQSVEQRTENPCVGGSIPSPATTLFKPNRINASCASARFQRAKVLPESAPRAGNPPLFASVDHLANLQSVGGKYRVRWQSVAATALWLSHGGEIRREDYFQRETPAQIERPDT